MKEELNISTYKKVITIIQIKIKARQAITHILYMFVSISAFKYKSTPTKMTQDDWTIININHDIDET